VKKHLPKPRKLILVTAEHHPHHKLWLKLLDEIAKEKGLEKEIRIEDYVFLIEHGDTDELGMAWVPQLLVELDNGEIKLLLSRLPLDEKLQPSIEKAKEEIMKKLEELEK
jgi:hypothetical protein